MIKKIDKIKNCWLFNDFRWHSSLPEFNKYNLFLGFNGSGKTTLAQAISSLTRKEQSEIPSYDIEITLYNGTKISNKNINVLTNPIYVFNKDFIEKNLASFDKFDEIIYLSSENIEKKEILIKAKEEFKTLKANKEKTQKIMILRKPYLKNYPLRLPKK